MKNGFLFARNYLELSLRNGSPLDIGEAYDFLGTAYSFIDDYNYSLKCYLKALNIFEELKHKKNIATTLNNIGVIYFYLNNYVKAYEFFNKALNNIDKSKSMNLKADITNNLGSVYDEWHNYNKALKYYNEALNIFILLNNRSGIATVYNNIGLAWLKKYDYAKALNFCFKALTINKKTGEQYGIANTYNNIALISLKQKNYAPVGLYLDSAIIIEKKINSKILLKEAYKIYSDLFIIKEDYKQVFNYYKKYAEINDSLQNAINYKKISELQVKYDITGIKEKIDTLEKQNEKQKIIENSLIFFLVFVLILIFLIINRFLLKQRMLKLIKEKNSRLIASEKELKDLNTTKDKFFSIIAHDLRNPFTALLGFSDLIIEDKDKLSKETILEYSKQINSAAKQLYSLLDNLLLWSRAQSGKIELKPEDIFLYSSVDNVIKLNEINAISKKINLVNMVSRDLIVFCDKSSLLTILRNLVNNAIKFTDENGLVTISAKKIENLIEVIVSDTGIGIDKDNINKLFHIDMPYIDNSNQRGTGLGLVISKEFIEKNGGSIRVESILGKGTDFIFTLPAK